MRRVGEPRLFRIAPAITGLTLLASLAAHAGCGGKPFAEGSSRELTVVTRLPADSPEMLLLRAVVEREALRIDEESAYAVRVVDPDDARAYRARNVLVVGYGDRGRIPAACRRLQERLETSHEPYAFIPDLWLRGQAAGIFWTDTREEWTTAMARGQNRFFLELDRATYAAVRECVLSLPHDARAERRLERELRFTLRVPRGFTVLIDRPSRAALLLEEGPPARLLRVQERPGVEPATRAARAALARVFRPDERTLDWGEPVLVPDEMRGAVSQLHGRWEDGEVSAAGPFRFYEVERRQRRYYVDLAVFAPGRFKVPYLRELHALAETLEPR